MPTYAMLGERPTNSRFRGGKTSEGNVRWDMSRGMSGSCQGDEGHVLVIKFRGMALNGLFCADVQRPLHLVLLTDFTFKYHHV